MWAGGFAARPHPSSHLPLLSPQSGESRGQGDEWGCSRKGKKIFCPYNDGEIQAQPSACVSRQFLIDSE